MKKDFSFKSSSVSVQVRRNTASWVSGYGVVTLGEAFKTIDVGVVHFSVSWFVILIVRCCFLSLSKIKAWQ